MKTTIKYYNTLLNGYKGRSIHTVAAISLMCHKTTGREAGVPVTNAPSLITKWVESKDFKVSISCCDELKEFYFGLSDFDLRYYFYKILVVEFVFRAE